MKSSVVIATLTLNPALDVATSTERVVPTHKLRCTDATLDPGGGGINVARMVHRLGGTTAAIFPVGGPNGAEILSLLQREGVAARGVKFAGQTRQSFAVSEGVTGLQYRFSLPGPSLPASTLKALLNALAAADSSTTFLVVSGSIPPRLPDDFLRSLGALAASRDWKVVLDTPARLAALGRELRAWAIKPSMSELRAAYGERLRNETLVAAARGLIAAGAAENIFVSMGAAGATYVSRSDAVFVPAPAVEPRSSIGAGDCMVAGLVLALERGAEPEQALCYGVACGSAALLASGTKLANCDDVERLHGTIRERESGAGRGSSGFRVRSDSANL